MTVVAKDIFDPRFDKAKEDKIEKLLKLGTYKSVPESDIERTDKILQPRFVLTIKNHGEENEFFKARLVILGYVDHEKPRVVNEAPTVMKRSIRTTLILTSPFGFAPSSHDVSLVFCKARIN